MERKIFLFLLLSMVSVSCFDKKQSDVKMTVSVTILPEKELVERIGGGIFHVNVMVPDGADPHTYEPAPSQMVKLSKSVVYFMVGQLPLEKKLLPKWKDLNPKMEVVDLSAEVSLLKGKGGHSHEDNLSSTDETEAMDPHIWLSPSEVKRMNQKIYETFCRIAPEKTELFAENLHRFQEEIDLLIGEIRTSLQAVQKRKILVYHPAWGYFAREFGLEQIAIEMEGKEASPVTMKNMIDIARREGIKIVFVQKQFDPKSAEVIAESIGGKVVPLDDLAEDWIENMRRMASYFKEAL